MAEFKKAKNIFNKLKFDPCSVSVAFPEEILDKKLLARLKKSKYIEDKYFFKLVNLINNNNVIFNVDNVNRTDYVGEKDIDRSMLYSFSRPFDLIYADVGNLEFLGKNATFPRYVLVVVDLFSSKVYTYPMKSRKQIRQRLEQFYDDVKNKRKEKKMRFQVDQEFQQLEIKDLNKKNNLEMFSTTLRGGKKAFAAEQKIRELKKRIAKLMGQKLKLTPKKIIELSTTNMSIKPSLKYGISPENIESKSWNRERFRTLFHMHRIEKTSKLNDRLDRYDKKIYQRKRIELRENLKVGEKVYILAERIKKKSAPGKFYKQSVQNISYFNKETIYIIRKKQKID